MEEKMQQEEEAPGYEGNVPEPTMYRNYKGPFLRMDGWQERVFGSSGQGFQEFFPDISGA